MCATGCGGAVRGLRGRPVITGFNTDVKYKGVVYHVQTEDKGAANPLIETLIYKGGEILGSRRLVFRDAHTTHWPWRRVAMTMLASGQAPFVNETASGGQPFLANPNAVLLYPTVLLEKVFSPAAALPCAPCSASSASASPTAASTFGLMSRTISIISRAFAIPTRRGRRWVIPQIGVSGSR